MASGRHCIGVSGVCFGSGGIGDIGGVAFGRGRGGDGGVGGVGGVGYALAQKRGGVELCPADHSVAGDSVVGPDLKAHLESGPGEERPRKVEDELVVEVGVPDGVEAAAGVGARCHSLRGPGKEGCGDVGALAHERRGVAELHGADDTDSEGPCHEGPLAWVERGGADGDAILRERSE